MIVEQLYPDCITSTGYFNSPTDYDPMIRSMGEVLLRVDQGEYQGDTYVMLHKDGRYGFVVFGWGSCSGCDAMQACESYEDLQDLYDAIVVSIAWFDSIGEARVFMLGRSGDWFWDENAFKEFKERLEAL